MKYQLPELPYAYDALEPFMDTKTMEIHHSKHHAAYVNNLNAALEKHPDLTTTLEDLLKNPELIPADIRTTVINNGGGHYNHTLFWQLLKINNGSQPTGKLLDTINETFGSYENFVTAFSDAAKTRFGSGWAWLVSQNGKLVVTSTANQDAPLNLGTPILALDVWEHAYYLSYQNRRPDFIAAFFNVINWEFVEQLYLNSL